MRRFLEAFSERGGKRNEELTLLLSWMEWSSDGVTMDPAMYPDWLDAVAKVRAEPE